jgi:hypothetical protein
MNRNTTARALQGIPIEQFTAIRAGLLLFLSSNPFLDSVVLHKLQVFDDLFMVPDPVDHVDLRKILQAFAGKVGTLETPGYLLLPGTTAEPVAAVAAGGIDMVGKAPIAANGLHGDAVGFRHFPQFFLILILIGEVSGAGFAVQPAVCIPSPSGRSFHGDPATHSTLIRPLIPRPSGHPGKKEGIDAG